jgi:hypothetical protein
MDEDSSFFGRLKKRVFIGGRCQSPADEKNDEDESKIPPKDSCSKRRERRLIPLENIVLGKLLGSGEFGSVYRAKWHKMEDDAEDYLEV